jgi:uncharacterized protein YoxC
VIDMAKGISISIASDTRDFLRGVKSGIIDPLEDASEALDDLGTDGARDLEKLTDGMRQQQRQTEELADEHKRLGDTIRDSSQRSSRDFTENSARTTSRAKQDLRELGAEARSNAAETFSSFDGSLQSFAGGLQGTLGGIVASLGPAGAIAGAAGAVGLGLITAAIQSGAEQTEEWKSDVAELGTAFIDAGQRGGAGLDYLVDRLKQLATATGDGETSLRSLAELADTANASYQGLARAYAGNGDQLDQLIRKERDLKTALEDQSGQIDTTTNAGIAEYEQTIKQIDGKDRYIAKLEEAKSKVDAAAQAEADYAASGAPELAQKAELVAAINDAYDDAAGSVARFIDKETGLFDVDRYIAAMEKRSKALQDYQTNLTSSGLSDEARAFLNEQGVDAAAQFLQGYVDAQPEQQRKLNELWSEAGRENSGEYSDALEKGIPDSIRGPEVKPRVDTSQADRDFESWARRPRTVSVTVVGRDPVGRQIV